MLGEAQNLTMSRNIIDRIFDNVNDCHYISLVGGEVLLEYSIVEYLFNKIIEYNWNVEHVQLTTNGTIFDKRFINLFDNYCKISDCKEIIFRISNDIFHDKEKSENAFQYYNSIPKSEKIKIEYTNGIKSFKAIGKGKKFVENNPQYRQCFEYVNYNPSVMKNRIKINNNTVFCEMHISSNGNIAVQDEATYEWFDNELCIGNILNNSLGNLIEKHNSECLYTCSDTKNLNYLNNVENIDFYKQYISKTNFNEYIKMLIVKKIFKKVLEAREKAQCTFEFLTPQEIILNLKTPKDWLFDVKAEIETIYTYFLQQHNYNYNKIEQIYKEKLNSNIVDLVYDYVDVNSAEDIAIGKMYLCVLCILNNPEIVNTGIRYQIIEKTRFFNIVTSSTLRKIGGSVDRLYLTPEFDNMRKINNLAKAGQIHLKNDKIMPCEIGDGYNKEYNIYQEITQNLLANKESIIK